MFIESGTSALPKDNYRPLPDIHGFASVVRSDVGLTVVNYTRPPSDVRARVRIRPMLEDNDRAPFRDSSKISSAVPKAILENWNALALSKISDQKYRAIYKLAIYPDGWRGSRSFGLKAESLSHFLAFWLVTGEMATAPHLSLSPKGHLIAEWYKNSIRNLVLEFFADGKIYVGLQDGRAEYDAIDNIEGAAEFLISRISKPLRWR